MSSYDETPYESFPVPYASPASLALAARWHGGPAAPVMGARVLEIGCGDGAHLLPLAFHDPSGSFVGLDESARAIGDAQRAAEALGLQNVRFERVDLAEARVPEGSFDYVVAHGVYSWIDAPHRAALRALARRALAPSGLAYVCFNAQPGWGVRGRVRDAVRGKTPDAARAVASALREWLGDPEEPWGQLLAHELTRVAHAGDGYLTHEYLAPENRAFWLSEVVEDHAQDGLQYVGDALALHREGWVSPEVAASVDGLDADPVRRAEMLDLVLYRQLRGAMFARDDAARGAPLDISLLDTALVFGALRPTRDPFDPQPGVEERFVSPEGLEIRVDTAIGKMSLLVLAARFPDGFTAPALAALAREGLAARGIPAETDAEPALREGLLRLVAHRALSLRLDRPAVRTWPALRPTASPLTRWEAARRAQVTSPLHTTVPLEAVDRAIVAELDGTRELGEIADALTARVLAGTLPLEGAMESAPRARSTLEDRADQLVTTLGWWGLAT